MKYKKMYVAGPFFSDVQTWSMCDIEKVLANNNVEMFRPRYDAGQIKNMQAATNEDLKRVFNNDIKGIDDCDAIIANLTFKDTGTAFEIGYAYAKGIPILLYNDQSISLKKVNLMLAAVAENFFNSIDELIAWFDNGQPSNSEKVNGHEFEIE